MIAKVEDPELPKMYSMLVIGLKNEIKNIQAYIDSVQVSENMFEAQAQAHNLASTHSAVELSKLVNLANIAVKLAHLEAIKSGRIDLTVPLTSAVDIVSAANNLVVSKISIGDGGVRANNLYFFSTLNIKNSFCNYTPQTLEHR
jgi:hypothetical protein